MNEEEMKKLLERVEKLEKDLVGSQEKINSLEKENKELTGKLASVKVDSLARKVEDVKEQPKEEEEITFDFEY